MDVRLLNIDFLRNTEFNRKISFFFFLVLFTFFEGEGICFCDKSNIEKIPFAKKKLSFEKSLFCERVSLFTLKKSFKLCDVCR